MSKITTGCDRCDNFYKNLAQQRDTLWFLEGKTYRNDEDKKALKKTHADIKLAQAKLDAHILDAHQLPIPF